MNITLRQEIPNIKSINILLAILFFQITLLTLTDYLLVEDSLYYDFWQNTLSTERINALIESAKRWKWVTFAAAPLLTLIKCFFVASCIYTGAIFNKTENSFADFFRITLVAEFIALLPAIFKILWFGLLNRDYGLQDLSYFSPTSLLSFTQPGEIDPWLVYPLHLINLFELLYWLTLAFLLKDLVKRNFWGSLGFVASTYGVGLFIWMLVVTFLTLSIS